MNRLNLVSFDLFKLNNLISKPYSTKFFTRFTSKHKNRVHILSRQDSKSPKYLQYSSNPPAENKKTNLTSDEDQKNLIYTIPNVLTGLRIVSIPFINYFVLTGQHEIACGLFVLASVTDGLDGYIARNFPNQLSHLGSILDPLADKLLIGKY